MGTSCESTKNALKWTPKQSEKTGVKKNAASSEMDEGDVFVKRKTRH
jgi:hypothetical protein